MSEGQGTTESATQDKKGGALPQSQGSSGSILSKPQNLGNSVGDTIQSTMKPVSDKTGKPLEKLGGVAGGAVDPTVGGIMRSGEAFAKEADVGFGNKEGKPKEKVAGESIGGKAQTADNPLGL